MDGDHLHVLDVVNYSTMATQQQQQEYSIWQDRTTGEAESTIATHRQRRGGNTGVYVLFCVLQRQGRQDMRSEFPRTFALLANATKGTPRQRRAEQHPVLWLDSSGHHHPISSAVAFGIVLAGRPAGRPRSKAASSGGVEWSGVPLQLQEFPYPNLFKLKCAPEILSTPNFSNLKENGKYKQRLIIYYYLRISSHELHVHPLFYAASKRSAVGYRCRSLLTLDGRAERDPAG